jgi:hypothetical protein
MEELPEDIILEIWNKVIFTYTSFLESFIISKRINALVKNRCKILGLDRLFMCTDKCTYSCNKQFEKPQSVYAVHEQIGNSGRKYNDVCMRTRKKISCNTHRFIKTTPWTCNKCKKYNKRPCIYDVAIEIHAYRYNTYHIPTIPQALNASNCSSAFNKSIFQNIKKKSSNIYSARMTGRDYYYWKGRVLQGIENLECKNCENRSFMATCVICDCEFNSTYYGKSPQLCETCFENSS